MLIHQFEVAKMVIVEILFVALLFREWRLLSIPVLFYLQLPMDHSESRKPLYFEGP